MVDRHIHPQLSQRMPQDILDKLDEYAKERGISRSKVVNDAALFYVNTKQCILCGAQNPTEGKICSCCGALLFDDDEIKSALSSISDDLEFPVLSSISEHNKFISAGYKPKLTSEIAQSAAGTDYLIKLMYISKEGLLVLPANGNSEISISPERVYECCKKNRQTKVTLPELDSEFIEPKQPAWVLPDDD